MKIATWNVNGIRAREHQFAEWLAGEQPDIVCLQEIKAPLDKIPPSICEIAGFNCYWHGGGGYSGVGLHVRASLADQIEFFHPDFDLETRIVCARFRSITVASVYVPNGGKDFEAKMTFLHQLEAFSAAEIASGRDLIVCGDMNVTRSDMDVHPKERKPNAIGQLPVERDLFNRMIEEHFEDLGRKFEPENDQLFTWWAPWRNLRQRNIGWRLDYIFATPPLAANARSCTVQSETGTSDHAPVVAVIDLP